MNDNAVRCQNASVTEPQETGKADLISSEAVRRRFHPNLFGFDPAEQDFIKLHTASVKKSNFVFLGARKNKFQKVLTNDKDCDIISVNYGEKCFST